MRHKETILVLKQEQTFKLKVLLNNCIFVLALT